MTTLPRQYGFGIALHLEAFVGAVVDVGVMRMFIENADRLLARGIKDDDIGVAADGDGTFGNRPKILAQSGVSSTNRLSEMYPRLTP